LQEPDALPACHHPFLVEWRARYLIANATLTFAFSDGVPGNAVGIDVLQGHSQQLDTEVNDNLLIIRDLQVKDYPIIIKSIGDAPQEQ